MDFPMTFESGIPNNIPIQQRLKVQELRPTLHPLRSRVSLFETVRVGGAIYLRMPIQARVTGDRCVPLRAWIQH